MNIPNSSLKLLKLFHKDKKEDNKEDNLIITEERDLLRDLLEIEKIFTHFSPQNEIKS